MYYCSWVDPLNCFFIVITFKNISSKNEVLSIDSRQGLIFDKYENTIINTAVEVKKDIVNAMILNGSTSRLFIIDTVNIQNIFDGGGTILFWMKIKSDGGGNIGNIL